jgi:hypothetical protein
MNRRSKLPIFVLTLRAMPGAAGIRALRWLLKVLLRKHKLRCISRTGASMSARIIEFPPRRSFSVRIMREAEAWLVVCREHGWLHGSRADALADANEIAEGFGLAIREDRA